MRRIFTRPTSVCYSVSSIQPAGTSQNSGIWSVIISNKRIYIVFVSLAMLGDIIIGIAVIIVVGGVVVGVVVRSLG